jgi:hypothetical protein
MRFEGLAHVLLRCEGGARVRQHVSSTSRRSELLVGEHKGF